MSGPDIKPEPPAGRGYEPSDVNVGRLLAFGAGVVLLLILGVLVSDAVFRLFVRLEPMGPPATPFEVGRELPPGLRLQTFAPLDLKHYRDEQDKILDGYGWVDRNAGTVRIPVDRAMDLLLQHGYPLRGTSPVPGPANTLGVQAPPGQPLIAPSPAGTEAN